MRHHNYIDRVAFRKNIFCLALLLLPFTGLNLYAQKSSVSENKIKAVFLFNFTRFIDWPESSFSSPVAPFIIGIIGNGPWVSSYIEEAVVDEKVGTHPIVVEHYYDKKEIIYCHILYINYTKEEQTIETIAALTNRSILTVSDAPNFNELGGMVRFYTEQNKIRLQINTDVAKLAQLSISSKLLKVTKTK